MTAVDDSAMISRYLLQDLTAGEQEAIERRYFSDPEYLTLMDAVEGDLIDAYVRRDLPRAQRQRFEKYFLTTRARRERLQMAEALLGHLPKRRAVPRAVLAIAATLALVVGLAAWLWPRASPPPAVVHVTKPPVVTTLVLMPGLTRDAAEPQTLVLPRGVDQVRVSALVEVEGDLRDLRASLRDIEGREVWSAENLPLAADRTVSMTIPASRFANGEHVLVLSAGDEVIGDYLFVVTAAP